MKKSNYTFFEEIDGAYVHYCSMTNRFLILNNKNHELFNNVSDISSLPKGLYQTLKENGFIVEDEANELEQTLKNKYKSIHNENLYNVVVNTTLDCNLSCWYCYENKVKGSRLTDDVVLAIIKNIQSRFNLKPYKILKGMFYKLTC